MGKLFGTDGIRGIANKELTCELAFKVGQSGAYVLGMKKNKRPLIVIGKDTRASSDMLEAALAAGICSVGADVMLLGVIPTPAVSYLTREYGADAGVVVSASHNPMEHNGIKFFNADGFKLSDEVEEEIEEIILENKEVSLKTGAEVGKISYATQPADIYASYLAGLIKEDLSGIKIIVDCANGAASTTARLLFTEIGAQATIICQSPDGSNINDNCGSTHLEPLSKKVTEGKYDIGIAFDGDADRCLLVDENGETIDGDQIIAVLAADLKEKNMLKNDSVVVTVMTNMGFLKMAEEKGIAVRRASVGDRYVLEEMQKEDLVLGGEQSGHIILLAHNTTGDGQLTAIKFLESLKRSGKKASALANLFTPFPQTLINIKLVSNEAKANYAKDPEIERVINEAEGLLKGKGRLLVRASGTEPLIRVMTECEDEETMKKTAQMVSDAIKSKFGTN